MPLKGHRRSGAGVLCYGRLIIEQLQNIEQTMQEIDEYERELAATKEGLEAAKAKNDRVISNFKSLLAAD